MNYVDFVGTIDAYNTTLVNISKSLHMLSKDFIDKSLLVKVYVKGMSLPEISTNWYNTPDYWWILWVLNVQTYSPFSFLHDEIIKYQKEQNTKYPEIDSNHIDEYFFEKIKEFNVVNRNFLIINPNYMDKFIANLKNHKDE